jgi:hypothetical protein
MLLYSPMAVNIWTVQCIIPLCSINHMTGSVHIRWYKHLLVKRISWRYSNSILIRWCWLGLAWRGKWTYILLLAWKAFNFTIKFDLGPSVSCDSLPKINVSMKISKCVYHEALQFMNLWISLTLVFSINF